MPNRVQRFPQIHGYRRSAKDQRQEAEYGRKYPCARFGSSLKQFLDCLGAHGAHQIPNFPGKFALGGLLTKKNRTNRYDYND